MRRRPSSLEAAVRGAVTPPGRGHLDWEASAGAKLVEQNSELAAAIREWDSAAGRER